MPIFFQALGRIHTALMVLLGLTSLSGCFAPWMSKNDDPAARREQIKETLQSEKRPTIVGQIAYERMITLARLENIALVNSLPGTGGKVKPSQPREKLLDMMRHWEANQPNSYLDDPSTAMVVAHVNAPPAARKGDVLDVIVQLSMHAEASSLRGGWLLQTPLVEMNQLGGMVKEGFEMGSAIGPIVTAAEINGSEDPLDQTRGIVIGGARLKSGRELGIGVETEFADAVTMAAILPAINTRFTLFNGRKQAGIAVPQDDGHIKISVPPRYQLDAYHFVNVVLQVGFNETETQLNERIETLRRQLHEPTTVQKACWQLEAIGERSIPILAEALNHPNPENRFHIAHALAYLNDRRAITPLVELCIQQPAFRAMGLNGLSLIDNYEAGDALESLLHCADAETRYGAVRALRHRDAANPQVTGKLIGEIGKILEIPTAGPPLVVVSLSELPEIVLFGDCPQLTLPSFVYVTPNIMLKTQPDGTLRISRFEAGKDDREAQATSDLRSILVGIMEVGGTYGNWVSFIREASQKGYMIEPLALNPVPTAGRTFNRETQSTLEPGEENYESTVGATKPAPRLWYNPLSWWN